LLLALAFILAIPFQLHAGEAASKSVLLSTTTSTQDSGLLDVLVPLFEKKSGTSVKTISVGTGQALALASRGRPTWRWSTRPALRRSTSLKGS
jgi:tungstate transport system substrate-binding protein